MKVMLVSSNVATTPYPVYPLGLSMVAAALETAGFDVVQYDFLRHDQSIDHLLDAIRRSQPDVIGISIRNIDNVNLLNEQRYLDTVHMLISRIKDLTDRPVVLGGAGFSILPELILEETGADFGIVGEGEELMVTLVGDLARGHRPKQRCLRAGNRLVGAEIPSATYDPRIFEFYLKSGNLASVQTKRGCTHKCVYCSYPSLEGCNIRLRDPVKVVDDIENLVQVQHAKYLFFVDSVFNDDAGAYLEIVQEMKRRHLHVPWTAYFKPDGLDDATLELLKETGLKAAEIGADAATDVTLKRLGKDFRFEDVRRNNALFTKHGIATAHFYMFGGPGETPETVRQGIENIISLEHTVSFMFMGIRILPGTPLAHLARKQGFFHDDSDLLDPIYYIAPEVDQAWLEHTLTEGFKGHRHCVFPPDALDSSLQFLHKLGFSGSLWDVLLPSEKMTLPAHKRSRMR